MVTINKDFICLESSLYSIRNTLPAIEGWPLCCTLMEVIHHLGYLIYGLTSTG